MRSRKRASTASLAKKFDEIANDYDGLAKYHEEMSKTAPAQ